MKRIFSHPPKQDKGRTYWRSLEECADTPEFKGWLEREFPAGAAEMEMDGVSRRNFLQLMGASLTLAGFGLSGCRRPEAYITPFSKSVEWSIPGKALFYASSMPSRKGSTPLVVTTYDGRPTKIEGNPLHPASNGSTDGFTQASILGLYDPDRSRNFTNPEGQTAYLDVFQAYLAQLIPTLEADGGEGLAFLLEENNSPTRTRLREKLNAKYPKAKFCVYEPLGNDNAREAIETAFTPGIRVRPLLQNADIILSLGSDFLGLEGVTEDVRGFTRRRKVKSAGDSMSRLYVAEHRYTVTGGMADHRLRITASQIPAFAAAVAAGVGELTGNATLKAMGAGASADFDPAWVDGVCKDLVAAKGKSLVLVGDSQPVQVHLLAFAINSALGSLGSTLSFQQAPVEKIVSISELASEGKAGNIRVLVVCGGNPSYNAPSDLDWSSLHRNIEHTIRLGYYEDETSRDSKWHIPAAHYLESWSDGLSPDGTYVPVQPMILPLFDGLTEHDLFVLLMGEDKPEGPELVRETFRSISKNADFEAAWSTFLRDGFLADSAPAEAWSAFNASAAAQKIAASASNGHGSNGFELVLVRDSKVDDGRYINNGWLQELPDPITKLTWDNAAWISPASAKALGAEMHEMAADTITIEVNGSTLTIPIIVCPGHADNSITLAVGYGQELAGRVGAGTGVNVYPLLTTATNFLINGAKISATGQKAPLAITHGHWTMEGRELFREGTLETYKNDPTFAQTMGMDGHIPPDISLYKAAELTAPEQWGMAIDLSSCTGCNACVVACQSENNIPIVGKQQVINQREMHWIRIDRYFSSVTDDEPNPEVGMQPVACMHCEMAPCETVCPVNATVHSEDGLNVMAYNRCIGTRYCANNCPYKVRRFNFFDYNKRKIGKSKIGPIETGNLYLGPLGEKNEKALTSMSKNPNVTVRMRGVMEKCTFCIQRIEEAKITARIKAGPTDNLKIPTDSVKTACQQVCAAEAIVFGDIKDPESTVAKNKQSDRDYVMLKYLNTRPRLSYAARLRNPNPLMPGADKIGNMNKVEHGEVHEADHEEVHEEMHPAGAEHGGPTHAEEGHH